MTQPIPDLDVLYEDNHLLVVNKPAGIATMGAESGPTVHSLASDYLKRKYNKPGNVYVGIVSRLDAMTSGVLVLARTSKAASRLVPQFGAVRGAAKIYLAMVEGDVTDAEGVWEDFVRKDDSAKRMRVVSGSAMGARSAKLQFMTVAHNHQHSLLAIRLLSGRKHQIRVQAADRGHPVMGDRKYDAATRFPSGIALHSWRLQIVHPTLRKSMWFEAGLPKSWTSLRRGLPEIGSLRESVQSHFQLVEDEPA